MFKTLAEFRVLDRRIWALTAARLVMTWAFSMVLPLMAVHLATDRGVPVSVVGGILTVAGICGALTQSYSGVLSDRLGRVPLLVGASIIRTVAIGALGVAVDRSASVFVIGSLLVLNNVARAFFEPPAQALIADLAPPEHRVSAFALQKVGINIGFTAGPAMGALASYLAVPYYQTFYWAVPVSALATLLTLLLRGAPRPTDVRPVEHHGWRALIQHRHDRAFMRFLLATFVFFMLQVQLFVTLPVFASGVLRLSRAEVMSLFLVNGVLVVLWQIPAAGFINRIGRERALVLGSLGYAIGYASVGASIGLVTVLMSVAMVTLSEVLLSPAQHAQSTVMAPAHHVGAYSGMFGLAQVVGQSLGPLGGTAILDAFPPRWAWIIIALLGVTAAALYRKRRYL